MKYFKSIMFNTWKLYIGIMFVSTLLLFYPIFLVFLYTFPLKHKTFKINVFWSHLLRVLCFYAIEIEDSNSADNKKVPYIICANHTSYLDIFLMYSILPKNKFLFMGKSEILSYPLIKTFFKRLNIPVFRGDRLKAARSFITARKELQKKWSIVIFPEGGIPIQTPYMLPLKDGAFKLAKSANVGILPITFLNNYKLFSDPENIFDSAMPGLVQVKIHNYITKNEVENSPLEELNKKVFEVLNNPLPKKE